MCGAPCWPRSRSSGRSADGRRDGAAPSVNVPVRIGIHTGPVVFGPIGDSLRWITRRSATPPMSPPGCSRAAEPGTILVSEATRRLAQGYARVEPVGPLTLKGKAEPIAAYRLLGVSHRRSGLRETRPGAHDDLCRPRERAARS